MFGLNGALVGHYPCDLAATVWARGVVGDDVEDFGVGEHLEASSLDSFLSHRGAGFKRVHHRHGGAVEATQDDVGVDEGHQFFDLSRSKHVGLDAPCLGRRHAALEFVHSLLGTGDLDTPGINRPVHVAVLVGALLAEQGHFLVVINWEDEVRGVTGRATGVRERTLVDEDHVLPSEAGKVADNTVADDASANDDDIGAGGEIAHEGSFFSNVS